MAGERFAVRNSGAVAVVEGVGDHGCEYMTGGRVIVIGRTGRNFAAGMSGGYAYILDESLNFSKLCNPEMVKLESLEAEDSEYLHEVLLEHVERTDSRKARDLLSNWSRSVARFIKVVPVEYRRVLESMRAQPTAAE
jgi:glutamate synthase domain-containing protein 3